MGKTGHSQYLDPRIESQLRAGSSPARRTPPLIITEEHAGKRRSPTAPGHSLASALHLLDQSHIDDLEAQLPGGAEVVKGKPDRRRQILRLVQHFDANPDTRLYLRRASRTPSIRLEAERHHYLGFGREQPWDVRVVREINEAMKPRITFPEKHPEIGFGLMIMLELSDAAQAFFKCYPLSFGAVLENLTIPDNTTLVTDLPSMHIEGELHMGRNARLLGLSTCGLRLRVGTLRGDTAGPMSEWAMISTSTRSAEEQTVELDPKAGAEGIYHVYGVDVVTAGQNGSNGSDLDNLHFDDGADGFCDLPKSTVATEGEGTEETLGTGESGGAGSAGASARPLNVTVEHLRGRVRFSASGGVGGQGGTGGAGQGGMGGKGGDMPWLCSAAGSPAEGGRVPNPGTGGEGGTGGDGGSGAWITLVLSDIAPDARWRACVRGGDPGPGGLGGVFGDSVGGLTGRWIGGYPFPQYYSTAHGLKKGDMGAVGTAGARGWNGGVRFNGEIIFGPNDSTHVVDFLVPPGAGTPEGCWNDDDTSGVEDDETVVTPTDKCVCVNGPVDTAITLTGPPNDAQLQGPLTWEPSPHIPVGSTGGYLIQVQLSNGPACTPNWSGVGTGLGDPDCFIADSNAPSYTPTGLQSGTEYMWRVRGGCALSETEPELLGPWSVWRRFVTP